jgi:acyl carrier protein
LTSEQIYTQLTEIFRELFDDESIVLTPETTAADIAEWDSFNHINLIVASEARFGVKFTTAEVESMQNVGQFVDAIAAKSGNRSE